MYFLYAGFIVCLGLIVNELTDLWAEHRNYRELDDRIFIKFHDR